MSHSNLFWTLVVSDVTIGIAECLIACLIAIAVVRHRIGVVIGAVSFWSLAIFIVVCGIADIEDVLAFWKSWYTLHVATQAIVAVLGLICALIFEHGIRTVVRRPYVETEEDRTRYRLHLLIEKQNISQLARLHEIVDDIDQKQHESY